MVQYHHKTAVVIQSFLQQDCAEGCKGGQQSNIFSHTGRFGKKGMDGYEFTYYKAAV